MTPNVRLVSSAIGYARVSTFKQANRGVSLEAQADAIRSECERRGWTLADVCVDAAKSGKSLDKRDAFKRALVMLDAGEADVLVAAKLDRLSRSVVDLAYVMERARRGGWKLCVLDADVDTTTAGGELVANVLGSVAQWERRIISERTKAGLAKVRETKTLGRPPSVPEAVRARVMELRGAGMTWQGKPSRDCSDIPRLP
jgi:DNA invertase Pin-like site-specific DNA recombinase